jgi:hypothetical protein
VDGGAVSLTHGDAQPEDRAVGGTSAIIDDVVDVEKAVAQVVDRNYESGAAWHSCTRRHGCHADWRVNVIGSRPGPFAAVCSRNSSSHSAQKTKLRPEDPTRATFRPLATMLYRTFRDGRLPREAR